MMWIIFGVLVAVAGVMFFLAIIGKGADWSRN